MCECLQHLVGLLGKTGGHTFRFLLAKAFQLIEELQLLTLLFRIAFNFSPLTIQFGLVDFPFRLSGKICTTPHREGRREHGGKSTQKNELTVGTRSPCHTAHDTEGGTETVIDSVDCLTYPSPCTNMPLLSPQQMLQSGLRDGGFAFEFLEHAIVRAFVALCLNE